MSYFEMTKSVSKVISSLILLASLVLWASLVIADEGKPIPIEGEKAISVRKSTPVKA